MVHSGEVVQSGRTLLTCGFVDKVCMNWLILHSSKATGLFSPFLVLFFALGVFGCGNSTYLGEVPEPIELSRVVVEENLASIDQRLEAAAYETALAAAIAELVETESARPFARRVERGLRYSTVYSREYVVAGLRPRHSSPAGLTPRGQRVLRVLEEAPLHGIDPSPFQIDEIRALESQIQQTSLPQGPTLRLEPGEVEALVNLVSTLVGEEDLDEQRLFEKALQKATTFTNGEYGLSRIRAHLLERVEAYDELARKVARQELFTADGALRYAREMRHSNLNRLDWRDLRDAGGSTEVILGRMQTTLQELLTIEEERTEEVFLGLEPSHWQYRALLEATSRYREIAAQGGWPRVRSFPVEEGRRSSEAPILRARLEAEGFTAYPTDWKDQQNHEVLSEVDLDEVVLHEEPAPVFDPEVVDQSLLEAIKAYQRTHQMDATGVTTPGFWRSLNLSVEERIEQMELTLQRWRESYLEGDQEFIFVNIPDFHAEVWRDGERKMRFPVVVGRSNRVCDPETRTWTYPNATPIMMSKMDHLILNPSWYLPPRLVRESLEPRVRANPNYFEEAGYETIVMSDGREVVRQLPGPENALGLVKFMFANEHNVYLHDTPQKQFFEERLRAFSFGCVRVSQPLELAQYIFDRDTRDELNLQDMLESGRTRQVNLQKELPVFLEYYTVWVDDEGWPHFLADPYRKDERRLSDDPDEFDQCRPPRRVVPEAIPLVGAEDDLGP